MLVVQSLDDVATVEDDATAEDVVTDAIAEATDAIAEDVATVALVAIETERAAFTLKTRFVETDTGEVVAPGVCERETRDSAVPIAEEVVASGNVPSAREDAVCAASFAPRLTWPPCAFAQRVSQCRRLGVRPLCGRQTSSSTLPACVTLTIVPSRTWT